MPDWLQVLLTTLGVVLAGPGFWTYMQRKDKTRSATDRLLRGLAYSKIVSQGFEYIERGWITHDEYEEYRRYLYEPYKAMGGNGVTERIMAAVSNLPIRSRADYAKLLEDAKTRSTSDQPLGELAHASSGPSS